MRIVVLEEQSGEPAIRAQSEDLRDERYAGAERAPDDWRIRQVDAASASALDLALDLKAALPHAVVKLIHLGPPEAVHWMRGELARGCDGAVRVWSEEMTGAGTQAKAIVLAAAARACGFDVVLAGAANATSAGGQLGVLVARHLGAPCITQASAIQLTQGIGGAPSPAGLAVTRNLAGGFVERVAVTPPAVLAVLPGAGPETHVASLPDLLLAREAEIEVWDVADLGVPPEALKRAHRTLRAGDLRPPRPRQIRIDAPDPSALAFDRILQLVTGAVEHRAGRVVRGTADEIAEEIFQSLRREGWLDHLRPGFGSGGETTVRGGPRDACAAPPPP